jgi:type IV secretion system protein VirB9
MKRALFSAVFSLGSVGVAGAQESEATCRPVQVGTPTTERRARARQVWSGANDSARQRPEREGFASARYVYTYAPGALYELAANPAYISAILLEEGETIQDIAAGDTGRWMVSESQSQGTLDTRAIVLVRPHVAGLRTNIVLVTNRRTYLVEAVSVAGEAYSAEIAWCYPDAGAPPQAPSRATLNFDYDIRPIAGRRPTWAPLRVFDDGQRTFIDFPVQAAASELPPLFIVSPEGVEISNYRVDGLRYIVDRTFERAELRLGRASPIIVRIERAGAVNATPRRRRRP